MAQSAFIFLTNSFPVACYCQSISHAITTAATNTDIFVTVIMMMVYNSFPPLLTLGVLCQTVKIILCQKPVQLLVTIYDSSSSGMGLVQNGHYE